MSDSSVVCVLLAAVPDGGGYLSTLKLILTLAAAVPFFWTAAWLDKDTQRTRMPRVLWSPLFLGVGIAGLLAMLFVPYYLVGFGAFVILVGTVGTIYVVQRNARVAPEARVLTHEHLATVFTSKRNREAEVVTRVKIYDNGGRSVPPPMEGTQEEKLAYNRAQDLLYDVLWRRASEADIAPASEYAAVKYVIDGVVVNCPHMEREDAESVIDFLKGIGGMDVADKRRPQSGKVTADLANHPIEMKLTVAGSTQGQRMQFKIVQEAVRTRLAELGVQDSMLKRVRELNAATHGLMIVSARGGNGVTSTLYSLLRDNDAYIKQLVTIEEKSEIDMENVTQQRYKDAADQQRVLAGVLRRDPDVVMVDKVTTAQVAEEILEAAREKKVLLGVKAADAFTALAKWVKTVNNPARAVGPVQAVLAQVLVRKLCPACKEAYRPDPEMLRKANLPIDKIDKFHRPPTKPLTDEKGNPVTCPTCQGSGYFGRTAAFELLEVTEEIRKLVGQGANLTQIKAAARKNRMLYMQEQALRLVMEGITSIQEVIRVTREGQ